MFDFAKNFYYVTYYETDCPGTSYETVTKCVGIIAARSANEAEEMLEDILDKEGGKLSEVIGSNVMYTEFHAFLLDETDIIVAKEQDIGLKTTKIPKNKEY